MTNDSKSMSMIRSKSRVGGFTLIEMLVVIGVIGILAAMVVALAPLAMRKRVEGRAKGELEQLITAIEAYKAKKGFYPPSNPGDETRPPLYFELKGTRKIANGYITLDGATSIPDSDIQGNYGVGGFVNSTTSASPDPDAIPAENFHTGLKVSQVRMEGSASNIVYLGMPQDGPDYTNIVQFTRWRYHTGDGPAPISRQPKHNKEGYDLWIELKMGGKMNTYGNWK